MQKLILLIIISFFFFADCTFGQISSGGIPGSIELNKFKEPFNEISVTPPDLKMIEREDQMIRDEFSPPRFSVLLPANIDLHESGTLNQLPDGTYMRRLKISAKGALALSLYFDEFWLSKGTRLFLYDPLGMQIKGAFTDLNNHKSKLFATELLSGDAIILEILFKKLNDQSIVRISEVGYAYRFISKLDTEKGFGGSDFCEVNVNCSPEGVNFQNEKNGVVRIQVRVSGSGYWCTGSLMNNVRNDNTPYILTADHCAFQLGHYATTADLNQWLFYFNYESAGCPNPAQEPLKKTMVGATKIAQGGNRGNTGSDFYLLQLNQQVPAEYNPYFMGWTAENIVSPNGVTIHHPEGDIKKISTYTTPVESVSWLGNGLESHWKVFWSETENGWGVTEGGSSGSPLLNAQGKIIGTLTGGYAACEPSGSIGPDKPDYYGKFSYHWQSNGTMDTAMLKPWLDPDNTGILQLDGKILNVTTSQFTNETINIFPNPTFGNININFCNFEPSVVNLFIINNVGIVIKNYPVETILENVVLNLSRLPAGIYAVKIEFKNGSVVKKFVKLNEK